MTERQFRDLRQQMAAADNIRQRMSVARQVLRNRNKLFCATPNEYNAKRAKEALQKVQALSQEFAEFKISADTEAWFEEASITIKTKGLI